MPPAKPIRGQSSAPSFSGDPRHLTRYFQDLEGVFTAFRIDTFAERFRDAKHYADPEVEDVFNALPLPPNPTWEEFKAAAVQAYPGAEDENRFVESDLAETVSKFQARTAGVPMTKALVGEYYRDFVKVATFLHVRGRIHMPSTRRLFLSGFAEPLQSQIKLSLQIRHPDVRASDGYDFDSVKQEALRIIEDGLSTSAAPAAVAPVAPPGTPLVKQEPRDALTSLAESTLQLTQAVAALAADGADTRRLLVNLQAGLQQAPATSRGPPQASSWQSRLAAPPAETSPAVYDYGSRRCAFCADPYHLIRECEHANRYMSNNILAYNDGSRRIEPVDDVNLGKYPGRNMMERLRAWLRATGKYDPGPAPQGGAKGDRTRDRGDQPDGGRDRPPHLAEANLLELAPAQEQETADAYDTVFALVEQARAAGKPLKFDGVEIKTGPPRGVRRVAAEPAALPANASATNPVPAVPRAPPRNTKPMQEAKPRAANDARPAAAAAKTSEATSKFQTPIEDPKHIVEVADRFSALPFTLTVAELLSLSPAVRKEIKERITAKRVPVHHDMAAMLEEYPDEDFGPEVFFHRTEEVGVRPFESLTLRHVTPIVGGKARPECVLDSGSMIVAMRKDIWMGIGAALDADRGMTLQAANDTYANTLGVVPDVPFDFGGVTVRLHVHVVERAPYEVLLGRPFFATGNIVTQDYENGEQHIRITDPTTKRVLTIPTMERLKGTRRNADGEAMMVTASGGAPVESSGGTSPKMYIPSVASSNKVSSAYVPVAICKSCCRPMEPAVPSPTVPATAAAWILEVEEPVGLESTVDADEEDCDGRVAEQVRGIVEKAEALSVAAELGSVESLEEGDLILYEEDDGTPCIEVFATKKYKKVANKVVPVSATLPDEFRIVRREPSGILDDMPELPVHPPPFTPGKRYTQERHDEYPTDPTGFLWPEERQLAEWIVRTHEDAFA